MSRAWVDEEDEVIEVEQPEFLKQRHVTPAWATTELSTAGVSESKKKRRRNEELDDALASTAPVLVSRHQRTANGKPQVISTFPIPKDCCKNVEWHTNSQLAIVTGAHTLYMFHASGKFAENVAKIDIGNRISGSKLCASGQECLITPHEAYAPMLVDLTTEKRTPLTFLDTRENFAFRHNRRLDGTGQKYDYITKTTVREHDSSSKLVAVGHGRSVILGSLSSGSVAQKIALSDPLSDVAFTAMNELTVALRDKLVIYDIRKSAKVLREFTDEGSIGTSCMAFSSQLFAIGSISGVVNVYPRGETVPQKVYKNLTTSIESLAFGNGKQGQVMAMVSSGQKNGLRLVQFPGGAVVPSFPDVGQRHEFIYACAFAPNAPIMSVGEQGKVTNYVV